MSISVIEDWVISGEAYETKAVRDRWEELARIEMKKYGIAIDCHDGLVIPYAVFNELMKRWQTPES